MPIPSNIAAKVLFDSNRTCCVCRVEGKPIQIHHIDGNNSNHRIENLAVLCLDCHNETQVKGGFHRKLDAEQIVLYRNDWEMIVAKERAINIINSYKNEPETRANLELLTSTAEILKENKQYELLAMFYDRIGNAELRDKYIDKVLSKNPDPETVIFLRSLQGKADLIPKEIVDQEIERTTKSKNWSQLARTYADVGRWKEAINYYCQEIIDSISKDRVFSAAYYLKEMCVDKKLQDRLFEIAYKRATEEKDLWWQIRSLQELGWDSELSELLKSQKKEIEQSGTLDLLSLLYKSLNDRKRYVAIRKEMLKKMKLEKSTEPKQN